MATTNPTSPQVLETYTLLQIAAEGFLGRNPIDPAAAPGSGAFPINLVGQEALLTDGNKHSSRMTPAQAAKFVSEWKVISHQPNTATGFSATLFESQVHDPARDLYLGKLVISIRSTEFIEDSARDSKATNELEIRQTGWAFGQIADMEAWWNSLPAWVRDGSKVDVTGYSLGGHLATAFYLMHPDKVERGYTFNGAGVGLLKEPATDNLGSIVQAFAARRLKLANLDLFTDPTVRAEYQVLVDNYSATSIVTAASARADAQRLYALVATTEVPKIAQSPSAGLAQGRAVPLRTGRRRRCWPPRRQARRGPPGIRRRTPGCGRGAWRNRPPCRRVRRRPPARPSGARR
jgi:pimeloyl-ACP methyl ester carboxylesterase